MPMDGIKVLDISRTVPGPYCSMLLTDAGAECILVEAPPGVRESARAHMRGDAKYKAPPDRNQAEVWRAHDPLRRNKRSIAINLKTPQGRGLLAKLAEWADVLIEGFRPGVTTRLGIDYATLSKRNPRLVYCSITGYGQTGPWKDVAGHDINYIALSGQLAATGRLGSKPAPPMNTIADMAGGGLMAAFAITQALFARERTGRGRYIDIAMADGVLNMLSWHAGQFLAGQQPAPVIENRLGGSAPYYDAYQCADGKWLSLGCFDPHFWANLCRLLDMPQFTTVQHDPAQREDIRKALTDKFRQRTRDEWTELFIDKEICIAPMLSLDEALEHPQYRARNMVEELVDPKVGRVSQVASGIKMSDTPARPKTTGPSVGQHTAEVLKSLGYDAAGIEGLKNEGVVA